MQIVDERGDVVRWGPGLPVETDFIASLCARVQAKGVGVGKSEAHVIADVRAACEELIYDLKAKVKPS
jgi:hypothetical protein